MQPPPQPRAGIGAGAGAGRPPGPADTDANTDRSRLAPAWPSGHVAVDDDSLIGRRSSKWESQVGQRYS